MAFTKALYYPWIDITDGGWLKNAMLYWDKIHTIVPHSFESPYKNRVAKEFYDEGLLVPFYVNPDLAIVRSLSDYVLRYIESPEGKELIMGFAGRRINPSTSIKIKRLTRLHPDKLSPQIQDALEKTEFFSKKKRDNWMYVDVRFGDFYMNLLASQISDKIGTGLLTNETLNQKFTNAVRLDAYQQSISELRRVQEQERRRSISLAQGVLADLILKKIRINPNTSVKRILKFREEHSDKLGCFRKKVEKLVSSVPEGIPFEALPQYINDIYINEVKPAMKGIRDGLTDVKINFVTDNIMKISFFSTSATSIPLVILGLNVPFALLAGAGASLILSSIKYNRKRSKFLRENPFSYLLETEKALNKDIRLIIK